MKRTVTLLLLIIISLFVVWLYFSKNTHWQLNNVPIPTQRPKMPNGIPAFCSPIDVQALLTVDHAAGNVYGTFLIKNISTKTCRIPGNNFITPEYDTNTIKNITVEHTGTQESALFTLLPSQTLYSQMHYPNGPQCQGNIKSANVVFTYTISPSDKLTFLNQENDKYQQVTVCITTAYTTTIQIWNMSSKPITQ